MGVEGEAIVEAIDDCPEIETGPGRVVTATFAHSTGECLEFDIEGESTPLRVTGGHPIWRESAAEQDLQEELSNCCNLLNAGVNGSCDCESPSIYSLPVGNRFSKYTVYQRSELNHCRFSVVGDGGLPGDASAIGPAAVLPGDRRRDR